MLYVDFAGDARRELSYLFKIVQRSCIVLCMRTASSSAVFTLVVAWSSLLDASLSALADLFRLVVVMSEEVVAAGVSPLTFVPLDMILV